MALMNATVSSSRIFFSSHFTMCLISKFTKSWRRTNRSVHSVAAQSMDKTRKIVTGGRCWWLHRVQGQVSVSISRHLSHVIVQRQQCQPQALAPVQVTPERNQQRSVNLIVFLLRVVGISRYHSPRVSFACCFSCTLVISADFIIDQMI